jgi:hypothetical protein
MKIRFGVELETKVPRTCGLAVGGYHSGYPVRNAHGSDGQMLNAPTFNGATWRADRDGSITCEPGETPCEFVSPILNGEAGVESLCQFVEWMLAIGAQVDGSCGCHITVGIESVIGSSQPEKVSEFVRKLAHIAQWHAMSLYGQTGSGRHLNRYSHTLAADVARHMRQIVNTSTIAEKEAAAAACAPSEAAKHSERDRPRAAVPAQVIVKEMERALRRLRALHLQLVLPESAEALHLVRTAAEPEHGCKVVKNLRQARGPREHSEFHRADKLATAHSVRLLEVNHSASSAIMRWK